MSDEIVFMDPPMSKRGRTDTPRVRAEMKPLIDRPGEWARVRANLTQSAAQVFSHHLRHGHYSGIDEGEFEAVSRSTDSGRADVFARYVGGES